MSGINCARVPIIFLVVLAVTSGPLFAQAPLSVFGAATPGVVDSGDAQPVVVGVKVFSDVPGQVLGCTFYKAPTNTGVHVVSLWDSSGKVLATQTATGETASGKQSVIFSSPVSILANQTFTCGYFAPKGHYSFDQGAFTVQKNVPPLHVPVNGGVYVYGTQATQWPTNVWGASNYWVDVLFAPSTGSSTWISGVKLSATASTASVTWNTAVPSDSQVEYGTTPSYGNSTPLATPRVTAHSLVVSGLLAGTTYHFRMRSRDSDVMLATGHDYTLTTAMAALPVSVSTSPVNATISSGGTQQFMATVSNTPNSAVTWSATAGTISSSGLFTAPTVASTTQISVTATSQADPSKSASVVLTVNPLVPGFAVNPANLSFAGLVGASNPTPSSLSITNTGAGSLTFTSASDQPWLVLSAASGTTPFTLQVRPSITALQAGTYTGHVTLAGAGATKAVTVVLTMTSPPVQHAVALSWKASPSPNIVSYSVYRSTSLGGLYSLVASALGTVSYRDPSVQSGTTYYYVVTAVDNLGHESIYSNETQVTIP
jgi:hypothetical protein